MIFCYVAYFQGIAFGFMFSIGLFLMACFWVLGLNIAQNIYFEEVD